MASKDNSMQKLLNFFGLAIKKTDSNYGVKTDKGIIHPGKRSDSSNKNKDKPNYSALTPIDFPSDIQQMYQYFLSNYSLYNANAERMNRYKELEFAVTNDGIMGTACLIYTEETYETKDGQKPVQIKAKDRKVEKAFYSWLDSIGFNSNILKEIAWNVSLYGDAFWINAVDLDKGVTGVTLLDPYLIKDKIEFNLNAVNNIKEWEGTTRNLTNKYQALKQISDLLQDEAKSDDYSLYYQSYLLGYELKFSADDEKAFKAVPPWAITHFKQYSTKSEFFPFGRPIFINSLARFKSYRTTEMLIDMLRVASFPKEHITIKGGDTLTPLDRLARVEETRQLIENISPSTNNKDDISVGGRFYSMEGLFEYDVIDPGIDIDKLGDLEMKRDDLILSTGIPDSYLIPSRGSGLGGENAQALKYNQKIFQRRVEGNKSAILEGIAFTFRLHLELTNQFDGEKTEFELFMPINAEDYSADKVRNDSDMLRLATDMMNNLGQALGMDRGESLPATVVRDIFKQYLPIDDDLIDKWINKILKQEEEEEEDANSNDNQGSQMAAPMIMTTDSTAAVGNSPPPAKPSFNAGKKKKEKVATIIVNKFIEDYKKGRQDDIIREAYFKAKKDNGFTNGRLGDYFYYNDTYNIVENSNKSGYDYTTYSVLRKHKLQEKARKLVENKQVDKLKQ